jgi:hypothetical protein
VVSDANPMVWETGATGNRARLIPDDYLAGSPRLPFQLSCAASNGSPDLASFADTAGTFVSTFGLELVVWAEGGSVMIAGAGGHAVAR